MPSFLLFVDITFRFYTAQAAGPLLLSIVTKVSKSTLLPVKEIRAGSIFRLGLFINFSACHST